jgi:hypothetical protein
MEEEGLGCTEYFTVNIFIRISNKSNKNEYKAKPIFTRICKVYSLGNYIP